MPQNPKNLEQILSYEPRAVWHFFAGLAAVPRPSKKEQRVREYVKQVAGAAGLKVNQDPVGNLMIEVPATPGREKAPITVLQGHLDMVGEKNGDVAHDFDRDPIVLVPDTDAKTGEPIVRAAGTTLGADNGIGVAMALAAATSPDVMHGPLELLFTIDEEAGMSGAKGLTAQSFKGKRMLNLDSEEDDRLYIGCAGGCDSTLTWTLAAAPLPATMEWCEISISGLRGGHSGVDIHEGRGSAIKLLTRMLLHANEPNLQLARLVGGSKRNAIAREATALVAGPTGFSTRLRDAARVVTAEGKMESLEPGLQIDFRAVPAIADVSALNVAASRMLIATLAALPHGVLGMHPTVAGLVETSNNVATVEWERRNGQVHVGVGNLSRSSSASRLAELLAQIAGIGRLAGAEVATGNDYPGWSPNPDSPLLKTCRDVYKRMFRHDPIIASIHAGLECGIIGERLGGMDMVSMGPTIVGAHSPAERVYVRSVEKSWKYFKTVLAELA